MLNYFIFLYPPNPPSHFNRIYNNNNFSGIAANDTPGKESNESTRTLAVIVVVTWPLCRLLIPHAIAIDSRVADRRPLKSVVRYTIFTICKTYLQPVNTIRFVHQFSGSTAVPRYITTVYRGGNRRSREQNIRYYHQGEEESDAPHLRSLTIIALSSY
ncbi:hypothetical protein A4A49_00517 [Nicotiana attenuata]|uniref:Uncharacterized protein n=1 Tax=Nicotiana attenuata TaxID=49451 RepID=A0A314L7Y5_NICAT|nr:hypothetical protein A4A49_00517 [Nicotiana attenuata]